MRQARAPRGFTLLEVMIGLALLGLALTVLIQGAASSIYSAKESQMIGVATDLARGKMYEIEEKLLKDGFTDTNQSESDKNFDEEGWPTITYEYKVEEVELPSYDDLQSMAQGKAAAGSGSGSGSGSPAGVDAFQNSALGGMLSGLGGGFAGGSKDIDSRQGASFIQGQYQMVQQILKVSIRKVTLIVKYPVLGRMQELKTVAFFTDAGAMDKVLMGLGSRDIDEQTGTGTGGTGTGSGTTGGGRGSGGGGGGRGTGSGK
ncbi:MAG: prepilin-type N-terminal cleavage/methylation domain-containing protein [Deltaproteobacteria bacterium]|nr:prepilin-type N-terminal cleavage/methylation domain-containing protein [Deltaproteobacteria bacterium]